MASVRIDGDKSGREAGVSDRIGAVSVEDVGVTAGGTFVRALGIHDALSLHPGASERVEALLAAAWSGAEAGLLTLCWSRMANLLGVPRVIGRPIGTGALAAKLAVLGHWPRDARFSELDRAALALAEQIVLDPSQVGTEMIDELRTLATDSEAFRFLCALAAFDHCLRLSLALTRLVKEDDPQ